MIGVYLRVSTDHQQVTSQRQTIARWVVQQRYPKAELVEYVDEGLTGATFDRPQFKRMLADAKAGKLTKVITFELSRLSRDFLGMLNVMKTLSDAGVEVEVPHEGSQPFHTVMDQFLVAAKSLVAAQEREHIKRRIKEGMAAAKARGVKLGARKGERRRAGKMKDHDPAFVERLLRLAKRMSTRDVAMEMDISPATVSRLLRRYSSGSADP